MLLSPEGELHNQRVQTLMQALVENTCLELASVKDCNFKSSTNNSCSDNAKILYYVTPSLHYFLAVAIRRGLHNMIHCSDN